MLRRIVVIAFALITSTQAFAARLQNANVVEHNGSRGLAAEIRQLATSATPVWITWDEPVAESDSYMCCFQSVEQGEKHRWRGGSCTLGEKGGNFMNGQTDAVAPLVRTTFAIYARAENGRIGELRTFSEDCVVDAKGATVHHISNVTPAESIEWLVAFADGDDVPTKKEPHQAASAIAMHKAPQAVDGLERLVTRGRSDDVRAGAAFWLGHKGGSRGRQVLRTAIDASDSYKFIDQAIAGIAQDEAREASDLLLDLAKHHRLPQVRKQSIFWLGQRAGEKATAHLKEATDDPNEDVREMAVFSISQLPADRAIPELIQLARTHKSKRVREKAIFWLGQSGDPRALEFIEEILTK